MHGTHHMRWLRGDELLDIPGHDSLPRPLQSTPMQSHLQHKNQTLTNEFCIRHFANVIDLATPFSNLMKFRFGLNCKRSSAR